MHQQYTSQNLFNGSSAISKNLRVSNRNHRRLKVTIDDANHSFSPEFCVKGSRTSTLQQTGMQQQQHIHVKQRLKNAQQRQKQTNFIPEQHRDKTATAAAHSNCSNSTQTCINSTQETAINTEKVKN